MNKSILEQLNENQQGVGVLCKRLNVTRGAIYQSINGYGSRQIRVEIALLLNLKPSLLWPQNDATALQLDDALYQSKQPTNRNLSAVERALQRLSKGFEV